jgi:TIR domain
MGAVFVCYAREDEAFVERLYAALVEAGREVWLDLAEIPRGADWRDGVASGIGRAEAIAFVISPDSLVSRGCTHELEHALASGKRVIPLLRREPEAWAAVPPQVRRHHWIFMRDRDDFDAALGELVAAIEAE